jgi:hypothetical protein
MFAALDSYMGNEAGQAPALADEPADHDFSTKPIRKKQGAVNLRSAATEASAKLQTLLPDPLAVLQAKDEFIQSAVAAADAAKEAAIKIILQQAAPGENKEDRRSAGTTGTSATTIADLDVNGRPANLQPQAPNLPAVRPGLADLRTKFHKAVKQGNTFHSPDTIGLSLSAARMPVPEAPLKPEPNFQFHAARTQEALRPIALKDGALGQATGVLEATPQPIQAAERRARDPLLQSRMPTRAPDTPAGFENYNFCGEMKKGTLSPSVPLKCLQERFQAAGGNTAGALYPTERSAAYYTFYAQPTYGDMMALLESVVAKLKSQVRAEQAEARKALFGDAVPQGRGRPQQGAELFIRVGPQRLLVRHATLPAGAGLKLGTAASSILPTEAPADFLIVTSIWSEQPHTWHLAQKVSTGMTAILEKELWDFEREAADEAGDFRNLAAGKYIANAVTHIRPLEHNFMRVLWSNNDEDRLLIEDIGATAQAPEPTEIPASIVCLTQEVGAPMMNFAVYKRERGPPPDGTYSNPQFLPTFGSGLRFEEFRNPDIFYSLIHDVEIDTRPRTDLPEYPALAQFKSKSFWQCTTPVSPMAWRTITIAALFDSLPTAGQQPMRCVAAAYPFFLYLAYTPAALGVKQGVYLYLYRLKDNSYIYSRVPIQKSTLYFISISYSEGVPGKLQLRVAPMAAARADISQFEKSVTTLEIHDDVFYSIMPIEGGSLAAAVQLPFISLGFQKYGLGMPGMNGRIAYFHVFDYTLKVADYEREVRNDWRSEWFI